MGMYTEFHLNLAIKKSIPEDVVESLNYVCNVGNVLNVKLPGHEFFQTERWNCFANMSSYYFRIISHSVFQWDKIGHYYLLNIKCNFKNYDDEIIKFLNWIEPYVDFEDDEFHFVGLYRYEEDDRPTLIYYRGGKFLYEYPKERN